MATVPDKNIVTATFLERFNYYNRLSVSWLFIPTVLLLLPPLLFSNFVPSWMPGAALIGLVLLFLLRSLAVGRLIGQTPIDWPLLLLLALGLWAMMNPQTNRPQLLTFIANLALCWAVATQRNEAWLRRSGWLLLVGGLVLGIIFLLGTRFSVTKLPFIDRDLYSILPDGILPFWNSEGFNANLSGGVLALFWPPALILVWQGRSWQERDMAKVVIVILSLLIVLTQSRGALLGAAIALFVLTVLQNRYWLLLWGLVLGLAILGTFYIGPDRVQEAVLGQRDVLDDSSLWGRQELWGRSIYLIQDFALTGVGLGQVESAIKLLYPTFLVSIDNNFKHAHNIYLQAGAELGLPGLIAHLALYLILLCLLLRRALDDQAGYFRVLALGLLGSLIIYLVHGCFEVITYAPRAAIIVWGLFGLIIAITTSSSDQLEKDEP